jgi:hypothetical protein
MPRRDAGVIRGMEMASEVLELTFYDEDDIGWYAGVMVH